MLREASHHSSRATSRKSNQPHKSARSKNAPQKAERVRAAPRKNALHPSWQLITFAIGTLAGAVFALLTKSTFFLSNAWLLLSVATLIFTCLFSKKSLLPLAFLAGAILVAFRAAPTYLSLAQADALVGKTVTLSGRISTDIDKKSDKIAITLDNLKLETASDLVNISETASQNTSEENSKTASEVASQAAAANAATETADTSESENPFAPSSKIYITLSTNLKTAETPQRSDRLTITGELNSGFGNYIGTMYRPEIVGVSRASPGDFFLGIRDWFSSQVRTYLSEPEAGLGLGYLVGVKTEVDEQFLETLQVVGLTHIIVASGTQLSILAEIAKRLFGRLSRFAGLLGSIFLILAFIGMTGLSPSMLRASFVAALTLIAWYFGRDRATWRILLFVVSGTLIFDPANLIDLGWLLSFGSFYGLLVLSPILTNFFFSQKPGFLSETVFTSLSAGLVCAPFLLYFFGSASLISIVANVLILPTISLAMLLVFLVGTFAVFAPPLAVLIATLTKLLLDYHIFIINTLGSYKFFLVTVPENDPRVFFLFVPILAIIIFATVKNRHKKLEELTEDPPELKGLLPRLKRKNANPARDL